MKANLMREDFFAFINEEEPKKIGIRRVGPSQNLTDTDYWNEESYDSLLKDCSDFERTLLEEVAGGDYDLARSILYDIRKND